MPEMSERAATNAPGTIYLYGRPGCHLCEEARLALEAILTARAGAPRGGASITHPIVERNIDEQDAWQRDFYLTIPVLELDGRRLELATSPARIRAFLDETLDGTPTVADNRLSC